MARLTLSLVTLDPAKKGLRLPFVDLASSPFLPGISPVRVFYREFGEGYPLIFMHGGWGYEIYPFDRQIAEFQDGFRIIIPDRTGYGRSMRLDDWPIDFHRLAAEETLSFLDALDIDRAILWGHSDGAVIAAMTALAAPDRVRGLILEAFHFLRQKPRSREFFQKMAANPLLLGESVTSILAKEHSESYWRQLLLMGGLAWLRIADESSRPGEDLYDGRLGELEPPVIFIHGSRDPRTEPGELSAIGRAIGADRINVIEGAGHSPHSESAAAEECNQLARAFMGANLGNRS